MANIKIGIKMHSLTGRDTEKKARSTVTANELITANLNFDVFGPERLNKNIYSSLVDPVVKSCKDGNDGTVLLYGWTSSDENYLLMGTDNDPDIHLLAAERLFKRTNTSPNIKLKIRVGYIEIYKEEVCDLLNERKKVMVDSKGQFDIKEFQVDNIEDISAILLQCSKKRTQSSISSHAIFQITIASENRAKSTNKTSYLRFVHVAGSELFRPSESQLKNADDNNKSLLWLNFVVSEPNERKKDIKSNSILTRILQESLRSDCNTAIICYTWEDAVDETVPTLDDFQVERKRELEMEVYSSSSFGSKRIKRMSEHSSASTPMDQSFCNSIDGSGIFDLEPDLEDTEYVQINNILLKKELEDVKEAHEKDKKWYADQMKSAQRNLKLQKLEDQEMSHKMRAEFEKQIEDIGNDNENLKNQLNKKDNDYENLWKEYQASRIELKNLSSFLQNENEKRKSNRIQNYEVSRCAGKHSRTMQILDDYAGYIIGKKRLIMNSIQSETGATIDISKRDGSIIRVVTITGPTLSAVDLAVDHIKDKILLTLLRKLTNGHDYVI